MGRSAFFVFGKCDGINSVRASAYTGGRYIVLEHIRLVPTGRIVCHQPSMSTWPLSTAACDHPTLFRKVVVATSALAHRSNNSDIKRRRQLALCSGKTQHKAPTSHLDRIKGGRAGLIWLPAANPCMSPVCAASQMGGGELVFSKSRLIAGEAAYSNGVRPEESLTTTSAPAATRACAIAG